MIFKVGFSKDSHNLVEGKEITLGGIKIPSSQAISAYSDGDIIIHCLAESIFGSMGLEDLGENYNSKTMEKNFSSLLMLEDAKKILLQNNCKISNIDILVELDYPKLTQWKFKIKENLSKILNIKLNQISVKATTTENNFPNIITSYCNILIYKSEEK
ncbi:2-C-methyl-D-erythritol 2,4-cyclodiphosphate synthase [Spiroplasma endosymbiont of Atherix ibis]|uniref:2-C-methyl-D-erythritol 2,4-cyclodiphosphate synthase n=1 Tax=Spiroplasma endosymbiont of Atherix ibis TaxID=3066291 RepID=UPI0030CBCB8A